MNQHQSDIYYGIIPDPGEPDNDYDYDDDEVMRNNGTTCPECDSDYVQVQNGDWVCPDCDLWL